MVHAPLYGHHGHDGLSGGTFVSGYGHRKVLSKKVHCRSLTSIHIDYNQALVGGISMNPDPTRQIVNLQLNGGSSVYHKFRYIRHHSKIVGIPSHACLAFA